MPHQQVHLAQARANEAAAHAFLAAHLDWSVTATFYAAVHYFEFWRFSQPSAHTGGEGHAEREDFLKRNLNAAAVPYLFLKARSSRARYLTGAVNPSTNPAAEAVLRDMQGDPRSCIDARLPEFKRQIKVELCEFLFRIEVDSATFNEVHVAYPDLVTFRRARDIEVRSRLGATAFSNLAERMRLNGFSFAR